MTEIELFKLGGNITLTRTDSVDLRATYQNVSIDVDSKGVLVLHTALDTIKSLQERLDKQKDFIYALDDLLEVVEINGLHDYSEYKRAKKLINDYNGAQ